MRLNLSLPSRERGLKLINAGVDSDKAAVAPFTGAWIEIVRIYGVKLMVSCRSLHGSVD